MPFMVFAIMAVGIPFVFLDLFKCLFNLAEIMAVNADDMEIKCLKFLIDRIRGTDFIHRTVNLESVIIHDHDQIIQFSVACEHRSFPDLTFFNLPVAKERINTVILLLQLRRECHSDSSGNPLSQRTAGHIHARDMLSVRMSL